MNLKNKINDFRVKISTEISTKKFWTNRLKDISKNKLLLLILIFSIIVGIMNPIFWSTNNWLNIIELNTPVAVIAIGMTLVILTSGIDLSVGSVIAFVGACVFTLNKSGVSMPLSIIMSIFIGAIVGMVQGFLVGYLKMIPFIVTLAGMLIFRGTSTVILDEHSMNQIGNSYLLNFSSERKFIGLSIQTWFLMGLSLALILLLKFTIFGRNIYATGGNKKASLLSGVNIKLIEMSAYIILGLLTSIASVMIISNSQSISPNYGLGKELDVIAMVVLGGTSLSGGNGGIVKTLIGWLILSVLFNALILLGYSDSYQKVFSGIIILVAVYLDKNKIDWKNILKNIKEFLKQKKWKIFYLNIIRRKNEN